jgi:hypothetical protein
MTRLLVAAMAAFAVSGCAETVPMSLTAEDAAGKEFRAPAADRAALYVYRPDSAASLFTMTLDQRTLAALTRATFLRVDVAPGSYDLRCRSSVDDGSASLPVHLRPGSTTYVAARFVTAGNPYCRLDVENADAGRAAVRRTHRAKEFGGASD